MLDGHLSTKWFFEPQSMHSPFFRRHSFSSGRSFPSAPRTFERSGFLDLEAGADDDDAAGVEALEEVREGVVLDRDECEVDASAFPP